MSDDSRNGEQSLRYTAVTVPQPSGQRTSSRKLMGSCLKLPQPWNPVRGFGSSDPNPAGSTSHPVQLCLFASVLQFLGPARILETVSPKLSVGPYLKSHHRTRLLSSRTPEGLE